MQTNFSVLNVRYCIITSQYLLEKLCLIAQKGKHLAVFQPGVGAPLAAGMLKEVIALGCRKFIACGGAGVFDGDIAVGHIIVPPTAIRDEGTSYHYLPPCHEVGANKEAVAAIEKVLQAHRCDYILSKTWTTDAIYRETAAKVLHRKAEGCTTVEMEAAAFFAVAQFRSVQFGQLLYGGDDVSRSEWDSRHWDSHTSIREKLFWLAAYGFNQIPGARWPGRVGARVVWSRMGTLASPSALWRNLPYFPRLVLDGRLRRPPANPSLRQPVGQVNRLLYSKRSAFGPGGFPAFFIYSRANKLARELSA